MIEINFDFPDLKKKVEAARDEINLTLAAALQTNRAMLFDSEGNYNGHPGWAPLVFRSGQILSNRGALRKSLAPVPAKGRAGPDGIVELAPNLVTIGTSLKYAAMMNWGTTNLPGGVLKPVRAKALKIPIPQGQSATDAAKSVSAESARKNRQSRIKALEARLAKSKKQSARDKIIDQLAKLKAQDKFKSTLGADKFIFRKSVKIPARRFDIVNDMDRQELEATLTAKVQEVLNR